MATPHLKATGPMSMARCARWSKLLLALLYQGEKDPKDVLSELRASGMPPLMLPSAAFNVEVMPKLGSGKADFVTAKKMAKELVEKK